MTEPKHKIPDSIEKDDILTVFGKRVKEERQKQHKTIEELAECAEVSDDTIKRIENNWKSSNKNEKSINRNGPSLHVAYKISRALGVPMQALLPMEREDMISSIYSNQAYLQCLLHEFEKN